MLVQLFSTGLSLSPPQHFASGCFLSAVIVEVLQTLGCMITHPNIVMKITGTVIFVKFPIE